MKKLFLVVLVTNAFIVTNLFGQSTPVQLEVEGKIRISDDGATPANGDIRWNDTKQDFEGFVNGEWCSLTVKVGYGCPDESQGEGFIFTINGKSFITYEPPLEDDDYISECDCFNTIDDDGDGDTDLADSECIGTGSIGNLVFNDADNNGLYDPNNGEVGVANVILQLFGESQDFMNDMPIAVDTTDANGEYLFDNLPECTYVIYIPSPPSNLPMSSLAFYGDDDSDNDDNGYQECGNSYTVSASIFLTAGMQKMSIDFGFTSSFECDCSDSIDNDGDGAIDCDDPDCGCN